MAEYSSDYSPVEEYLMDKEEESKTTVEAEAEVEAKVEEPVEEPKPKRKTRRSKPSRARVRKIRGGSVTRDGEDYSETGKVYEVSKDVEAWLLNLTDGYGRHYFESA